MPLKPLRHVPSKAPIFDSCGVFAAPLYPWVPPQDMRPRNIPTMPANT